MVRDVTISFGRTMLSSANLDWAKLDQARSWHWNAKFKVDYDGFE